MPDFDPNNLSEAKIKHYITSITQKYITYWQHTVHHSKELQFYSIFKHDNRYKILSYLDSTNRKDFVKIRKKPLEDNQTPHNDTFCPVCNSGIIEDEFHFLLNCPKHSVPGENFHNHIQ